MSDGSTAAALSASYSARTVRHMCALLGVAEGVDAAASLGAHADSELTERERAQLLRADASRHEVGRVVAARALRLYDEAPSFVPVRKASAEHLGGVVSRDGGLDPEQAAAAPKVMGPASSMGYAVGGALSFPADHGPHPASRSEGWDLTVFVAGGDAYRLALSWHRHDPARPEVVSLRACLTRWPAGGGAAVRSGPWWVPAGAGLDHHAGDPLELHAGRLFRVSGALPTLRLVSTDPAAPLDVTLTADEEHHYADLSPGHAHERRYAFPHFAVSGGGSAWAEHWWESGHTVPGYAPSTTGRSLGVWSRGDVHLETSRVYGHAHLPSSSHAVHFVVRRAPRDAGDEASDAASSVEARVVDAHGVVHEARGATVAQDRWAADGRARRYTLVLPEYGANLRWSCAASPGGEDGCPAEVAGTFLGEAVETREGYVRAEGTASPAHLASSLETLYAVPPSDAFRWPEADARHRALSFFYWAVPAALLLLAVAVFAVALVRRG